VLSRIQIRSLRIRTTQDDSLGGPGARPESSTTNNDGVPASCDVADKQQHRWMPSEFRVSNCNLREASDNKWNGTPTMRTGNFPLRLCFSPALVVSMALTYPAKRRARNLSALRSTYPGLLYTFKCDPPFEPGRASSRRSSVPKSGDDHFRGFEVMHKQQCLSMPLKVASVVRGTLSGCSISGLSLEKHRDT
jgi:hypothetical protein